MYRAAKNVSITALTLISPSPRVTGIISLKTWRTAGSRQSMTMRRRSSPCSSPRSHGTGRSTWITVATTIEPA